MYLLTIGASILLIDAPSPGLLPFWTRTGILVLGILFYALPIFAIAACLYGWYTIHSTKEKGAWIAILIIALLGVYEIVFVFQKFV